MPAGRAGFSWGAVAEFAAALCFSSRNQISLSTNFAPRCRAEADRLGAEFLGEIPLLLDIRTASDAGTPIAASAPNSEAAKAYAALARRVWEKVGGAAVARGTGPRIVIE